MIECATATAESLQSCPTLCDSIDGSPPGSSVPGILQARTLEWVAMIECIYLLFLTNNFRFFKIEGAVIFGQLRDKIRPLNVTKKGKSTYHNVGERTKGM